MVKLPKKLVIEGKNVPIVRKRCADFGDDYPCQAEYSDKGEIVIDPNCTRADVRDGAVHELLHHLFKESGLKNRVSKYDEEVVITFLTPWLLSALMGNPALVDFLLED